MDGNFPSVNSHKNSSYNIDSAYSFHLVLFSESDEMYELWLPKTPEGVFRFSDKPEHRFLTALAKDGEWYASTRKPAFFQNVSLNESFMLPLRDRQLLTVDCGERSYSLLVEQVYAKNMIYRNYSVSRTEEITIGSHFGNDICYQSPLVSPFHAVLSHSNGQWVLRDKDSEYGTFVDGIRVETANLVPGCSVYIMGLKIIIGASFLSITDELDNLVLDSLKLQSIKTAVGNYSRYNNLIPHDPVNQFFNRMPRKRLEMAETVISVEGPPPSMDSKQVPLMLRMGSSMVMGGTAALAGNFTTLISSVLFPFLSSRYTDEQKKDYERLRTLKYREYLAKKKAEITKAGQEERELLNQKYPAIQKVLDTVKSKEHLWERRPGDNDFMHIRVGTGTLPMKAQIDYPPRRFALDTDYLEEEMYTLVESPKYLDNVPIVLSLMETRVCGLTGDPRQRMEYLRQMILQICTFHSYDEVKTIFFLSEEDLNLLSEIRYLPHTWDDQRSVRFIATDEAEAYRLGDYLKNQIADSNGEKDIRRVMRKRPFYVIFALSKKLFESHETLKEILQFDDNPGFSVVTAYNELPKESQIIISLQQNGRNVYTTMMADGGEDTLFSCDSCGRKEMLEAGKILANTKLRTADQEQVLPKTVTFMEMLKTGRVEQLNALNRWEKSNPVKSLAAPVGVSTDGELFYLDLHEKRQGPHGLVAGMTGSGKSEFIITYILSMAVNYHPDEVAFVLIDYKGGGLAGAFENPQTGIRLPHLVGTITNLDGASIQRSLTSIESELLRRQRVFNEVKSAANEGTMDIYAYQKLYRAGKVSEPMPHLFIISDEFAELKQQQPEFMAKLISAARIGRSLGVHLILATQKPSGVVDDQIRSNTKFRVCLRVQERSDSMDMLKRPEAAELTDTGRFYLQVGYNEFFALGQSAWCGAPYEPQDAVSVQRDESVEFLDTTGQVLAQAKPKVKKTDSGTKQIVAIVEYLSKLADTYNIHPRQLWEPELPRVLDLDEMNREEESCNTNSTSVTLGKLDDPELQNQYNYTVDFHTCQNILITGTTEAGKTTILQNIIYTLVQKMSPKDFNFYVLDFSSRMMKLFKALPHCGVILQEEDAGSMDEFFKLINGIIAERKHLFSELEVDSFPAALNIRKLPLILVLIDNIASLSSSKIGEKHMYQLQSYMKDSYNYGVTYIVTSNSLSEVPSRLRQELGSRIALHQKDKYDYSELLGCKVSYIPPEIPGRGLCELEGRPLEFQGALIRGSTGSQQRTEYIKEVVAALLKKYGHISDAQRLPVIRDDVTYEEFAAQFKKGRIPLGYSQSTKKLVALPLKQLSLLSVYFGDPAGTVTLMNNFLHAFQRENMELWVIRKNKGSLFVDPEKNGIHIDRLSDADYMDCSVENMRTLQQALLGIMAQRKQILERYCKDHQTPQERCKDPVFAASILREQTKPILLLLENVGDFCASLNALAVMSYCNLFKHAHQYNIYVVSCLEPDIPEENTKNALFGDISGYDMLLFGGNFDKQVLYTFSNSTMSTSLPFNMALMIYRKSAYALTMPCGMIGKVKEDEDLLSIF